MYRQRHTGQHATTSVGPFMTCLQQHVHTCWSACKPEPTFVRFSVASSMTRCTSQLLVLLLKFTFSVILPAGSRDVRKLLIVTDLEVPDSPTRRQGLPDPTTIFSSHVVLQQRWRSTFTYAACLCGVSSLQSVRWPKL